ncbi:hypothetical protein [Vibrio parahaemolyticus]|uniref:Uncharacterized protein n=10 Tax=Vibrio parahaemolyticus TaxID=670 RepID=A0A249W522_VIBPH|nr:hypothetical protein [Vibrio parahaemolyticus]EVU21539.1 hypothetical protein D046_0008 [Vibrio parahaemolyticus V-223/04]ASZ51842.1 hypothetical protein YA91_15405 [Vibrio parahaemolyticus]ASZ51863.1 hypothetical protein YA91_15530 [Vibrio parahaemolyticus]AUT87007.1 hypothetical protein RK51_009445 [Vibrio parahaemolyticus]AUT87027.1 hypothetical protein RK51_009565 [Vibrio parahaemolyticus]
MDRYEDIKELLDTVEGNISTLRAKYEEARKSENVKVVLRPLVKSTLEHLRSALEYSAQDIWSQYNTKSKKLYFPYGLEEALFQANVKRNLPNLKTQLPHVYQLLESIQPFKSGDDWLKQLCDQTNFNKHNRLTEQVRKNSEGSTTNVGNLVSMRGGGRVVFDNCSYNGMPLGQGKRAVISSDMSVEEIEKSIAIPVKVNREFDWVEFHFDDSAHDTLELIETSHRNISLYIEELRKLTS